MKPRLRITSDSAFGPSWRRVVYFNGAKDIHFVGLIDGGDAASLYRAAYLAVERYESGRIR